MRVLLNLLFSFVVCAISEAVDLALNNPFVKLVTELPIAFILIDDLRTASLLALISDIIPPHYTLFQSNL